MTIISPSVDKIASILIKDVILSKKYASSFIRNYINVQKEDSTISSVNMPNAIKHITNSFDGEEIESYEIKNNNDNKYLFILHGINQEFNDLIPIINGFKEFNLIIIKNRTNITYGIKESLDLVSWINYYKSIKNDILISLFGEFEGSNTIIKTLGTKLDSCVKCAIVDDPNTTLVDSLLDDFVSKKELVSLNNTRKMIDIKMKETYGYPLKELNLKGNLKENEIPILFIFSKVRSNYLYKNLLKIFNNTKGEHKIFLTSSLNRNLEEENYFETLSNYIKKLC